jgi:hypothetical protein
MAQGLAKRKNKMSKKKGSLSRKEKEDLEAAYLETTIPDTLVNIVDIYEGYNLDIERLRSLLVSGIFPQHYQMLIAVYEGDEKRDFKTICWKSLDIVSFMNSLGIALLERSDDKTD